MTYCSIYKRLQITFGQLRCHDLGYRLTYRRGEWWWGHTRLCKLYYTATEMSIIVCSPSSSSYTWMVCKDGRHFGQIIPLLSVLRYFFSDTWLCVSHLFCSQRIPPSHHYVGYGPLLSFTQHGATSGHTPLPALVISLSSSPQQKKLIIAKGSPLSQFTDCVLSAIIRCIVLLHHQSIERTSSSLSLHGQSQ